MTTDALYAAEVTPHSPLTLYGAAIVDGQPLRARLEDGARLRLDIQRWLGGTDAADHSVLDRASSPVLDVGCGPGRLVVGAAGRGLAALGLDVSPDAVAVARDRGAHVIEACVFADAPGAGSWGTILLLDGNIGIGGDAAALLRHVRRLLTTDGRILVEVEPPGSPSGPVRVRLEAGPHRSAWFPWARVGADRIAALAGAAALTVTESWEVSGRCFARLDVAA